MRRHVALGTTSALLLLAAGCSSGPKSSSTTTSTSTSTSTSVTTTAPSQTTVATSVPSSSSTTLFGSTNIKGTTVLSQQGESDVTSDLFTIPSGTSKWDLAWSYECSGAATGGLAFSNVVYIVYKGDSVDKKDPVVSSAQASDQGTKSYTDSGDFTIHVTARLTCTWSMKVIIPSS